MKFSKLLKNKGIVAVLSVLLVFGLAAPVAPARAQIVVSGGTGTGGLTQAEIVAIIQYLITLLEQQGVVLGTNVGVPQPPQTFDDDFNFDERNRAERAIERADEVIEELEDLVNEAEDQNVNRADIRDAEEELDDVEDRLRDAEDEFDDRDYGDAEDEADEARDIAEDAIDDLGVTMSISRSLADDVMERAEDAIDDLEKLIEGAEDDSDVSNRDIDDAEDELEEAEDLLLDAEDEFDDRNFKGAWRLVRRAREIAWNAFDELAREF